MSFFRSQLGEDTGGSGSKLPPMVFRCATLAAGFATLLSFWCLSRQLKNYRKPMLQRFVVRIIFMVPIYSISSSISLWSLNLSFFIDLVRDIYEAFVIYCFFSLLVEYLGGERRLLISLHGRQPTPHIWPFSKILKPMDISDPYTFLNLKRGILQYVQLKPILAVLTMIFKATRNYNDGALNLKSGYTYISIAYNFSVSICLYCLAMFWVCMSEDLKPFRPVPKFLCVKGIIFFSFWQGFGISILVAAGLFRSSRYGTETLSLAIQDTMICFEMPLFAFLHLYAFSHKDYIDKSLSYCGRLPFVYAFRDSILGFKDVLEDSSVTMKGTGFSYKTFEPCDGALHQQGFVRERRVRAGLRYQKGGKQKYWLPIVGENENAAHGSNALKTSMPHSEHPKRWQRSPCRGTPWSEDEMNEDGESPRDLRLNGRGEESDSAQEGSDFDEVEFGEPKKEEELLYCDARRLEFGDYNSPVVDASKEEARRLMRVQEDELLANHPAAPPGRWKGKGKAAGRKSGSKGPYSSRNSLLHDGERVDYAGDPAKQLESCRPGKMAFKPPLLAAHSSCNSQKTKGELPDGCVDLLVEDVGATPRSARRMRLKSKASSQWSGHGVQKVFRAVAPEPVDPCAGEGAVYRDSRRPDKETRRDDWLGYGIGSIQQQPEQSKVVVTNVDPRTVQQVPVLGLPAACPPKNLSSCYSDGIAARAEQVEVADVAGPGRPAGVRNERPRSRSNSISINEVNPWE